MKIIFNVRLLHSVVWFSCKIIEHLDDAIKQTLKQMNSVSEMLQRILREESDLWLLNAITAP